MANGDPDMSGWGWSDAVGWYRPCCCSTKVVGMDWQLSDETKQQLKEIDQSIRNGHRLAGTLYSD